MCVCVCVRVDVGVCVCVSVFAAYWCSVSRITKDSFLFISPCPSTFSLCNLLLPASISPPPCHHSLYSPFFQSISITVHYRPSPAPPYLHLLTDIQPECSRSDLAQHILAQKLTCQAELSASRGKTDESRRHRETETKRRNHRGRRREIESNGKRKTCCKCLDLDL